MLSSKSYRKNMKTDRPVINNGKPTNHFLRGHSKTIKVEFYKIVK